MKHTAVKAALPLGVLLVLPQILKVTLLIAEGGTHDVSPTICASADLEKPWAVFQDSHLVLYFRR